MIAYASLCGFVIGSSSTAVLIYHWLALTGRQITRGDDR
jgi:hypothetical protein